MYACRYREPDTSDHQRWKRATELVHSHEQDENFSLVSKLERLTRLPALWTLFGVGIIRGVRSEFRSSLKLDTVSRKPPPASETCSPTNVTCHHRS
eukprot:COSAG06_NODE_111_length_23480_cov_56.592703_8_plen_96_part_00